MTDRIDSDLMDRWLAASGLGSENVGPADMGPARLQRDPGWRMVPLSGKVPLVNDWPRSAASDPARLDRWADLYEDCNWGIVTGEASGLVVVDIDNPDAEARLRALCGGELPATYTVRTGRAGFPGRHLYFRHDPAAVTCDLARGLEVKVEGRQVVAPGSVHPESGQLYRVELDLPLAPLPAALLSAIRERAAPRAAVAGTAPAALDLSALIARGVPEGQRDETMTKFIGRLVARMAAAGLDVEEARLLAHEANRRACRPPLDAGAIDAKVDRFWARDAAARPAGQGALPLLTAGEMAKEPAVRWLVPGLLPVGALAVLHGPPGTGKSFVALDLALTEAAQGRPVLVIVGEGRGGVGPRVTAWAAANGCAPPDAALFRPGSIDLTDPVQVEALIDQLRQRGVAPVLAVVDTLARNMRGDENKQEDMGKFVAGADRLRTALAGDAEAPGCTVLVLHHPNKGQGKLRGSSVLEGAADTVLALEKRDGNLLLTVEKQKDGAVPEPRCLALQPVPGTESCVVTRVLGGERPAAGGSLKAGERRFLDALQGTMGKTEWWQAAGVARGTADTYIARLLVLGLIVEVPAGGRTRYRHADPTDTV